MRPEERSSATDSGCDVMSDLRASPRPRIRTQFLANPEPPVEPADSVTQRVDLTFFVSVFCLDRNGTDAETRGGEPHEQFGLDFEMLRGENKLPPRGQMDHAETALGIGNINSA